MNKFKKCLISSGALIFSSIVAFAGPPSSPVTSPNWVNVKDPKFGAVCDGGNHPLSGRFSTLAKAQAVYPFITSLTQQIDYAALKLASNTALGADGSEHGTSNSQLNQPIYIPAGICNLGNDTWKISKASGIRILGDGTRATQLVSSDITLATDGLWYSEIANMTITTTGGITTLDIDGNVAGSGTTFSVQANTFPNLLVVNSGTTACTIDGSGFATGGSCYAVANCRQGQSNAQCSEDIYINLHTQGGTEAGFWQVGSNALDDVILGGDIQAFPKNGVELAGGSIMILKTSFEGNHGYTQIMNGGCDVQASAGGSFGSINVYGSRSEDLCVYNGAFSQWADLRGISQNVAAYIGWSNSTGFSTGFVTKQLDPNGFARMYLVTTAGITGGSEPTWPVSGTVSDGSVVWTMTPFNAISIAEGSFDVASSHLDGAADWVSGTGISALTSCGGGTPSALANSTRWGGTVTEGSSATGCAITFGSGFWFNPAPQCIVTGQNGPPTGYSINPLTYRTLTITNPSADGNTYTWRCWQ